MFFEPDVDFVKSDKKENLLLKFIPVFLPHKKLLFYSLLSSILLLAFGIISSFYYKYMFDEVLYSKAKFSLHTLSFGVLLVVVVQSESRRLHLLCKWFYESWFLFQGKKNNTCKKSHKRSHLKICTFYDLDRRKF